MTQRIKNSDHSTVMALVFDSENIHEKTIKDPKEIEKIKEKILWIRIIGKVDKEEIKRIVKALNISTEAIEESTIFRRSPFVEASENLIIISFRTMTTEERAKRPKMKTFFAIITRETIVTWEQAKDDIMDKIKENLLKRSPKDVSSVEILYKYLEGVLEYIYAISEKLWDNLEILEDEVLVKPTEQILRRIQRIKRDLILMRKTTRSIREVASRLSTLEINFLSKKLLRRFEGIYKHAVDIMESIETLSEILSSILDIYVSSIGNKTNEIMKVLTIIGTIFIPLTFITGIYGMNFKYMPELYWKWSYPLVLIAMFLIAVAMLIYFRKKEWL